MKPVKIGNKHVGDGRPVFVIAEMAWSHDGSTENAKKIIDGAAGSADALNVHITSLPDYMVEYYAGGAGKSSSTSMSRKLFEYLESINIKFDQWKELFAYAKIRNVMISALCNDLPSAQLASTLEPDLYSIHPSCLAEEELVRFVARQGKPVIAYIGGTTLEEIHQVIAWVKDEGNDNVMLLYGIQSYPTKVQDSRIGFVNTLKTKFDIPTGFADHTEGGTELSYILPIAAVALGANIIEKHITHDRSRKGEDYEAALNPDEFKKFVEWIRRVESSISDKDVKELSPAEIAYRGISRKKIVAKKEILSDTVILADHIVAKRSDVGLDYADKHLVIGKKSKFQIAKDQGILVEMVY